MMINWHLAMSLGLEMEASPPAWASAASSWLLTGKPWPWLWPRPVLCAMGICTQGNPTS